MSGASIDQTPWNLTERQVQAMDAVVETGLVKLAAMRMGATKKAVENLTQVAIEKIGEPNRVRGLIRWAMFRANQK